MRALIRTTVAAAGVSFMLACGGGGTDDPVTPPTPAITLTATTATASVVRGATASFPLSVTRTNYTGDITLSASGLPTGVTFTPATITGGNSSGTVQLVVSATATPGTSTVTITGAGSNGTPTASTTVQLTIEQPAIALATPAPATIVQGGSVAIPISLTSAGGFTGPLTIIATGLPAGVTTLGTAIAEGTGVRTGTLTLNASAAAATGTSNVTITANSAPGSGVAQQSVTFALTVNAAATPGITLAAAPATVALIAGQSTATPIQLTLARQAGFAGAVGLVVTGAPTGVTTTLGSASLSGATTGTTLTIATTAATTPGTYTLTITGTSGTITGTTSVALTVNAIPGITLTAGPTTLSIAQGASAQSTITLARQGNFTGDIALTATGLPTGATATFAPTSITGASTTSVVTIQTVAGTPAGTYNIVLTGTGPAGSGVTNTVTVSTTVTTPQGFSIVTSNVSAAQGSTTGTSTVTITRTGGYTGAVSFAVSGLPANVTAVPSAATTGNTGTITFNVGAGATIGTSNFTVTATGAGITGNQTAAGTLTVSAVVAGTSAAFRFCAQNFIPEFFAYRDGTTGAWTPVAVGANNTYNVTFTGNAGGVVYGDVNGANIDFRVFYYLASELPSVANQQCIASPAVKTVNGTVAGLSAQQSASISLGAGTASVSANGPFQITNATDGVADLIATRTTSTFTPPATFSSIIDRLIIRRNINPAAGGAISGTIDFGAAEAVAPAAATYTVGNVAGDVMSAFNIFRSANGSTATFINVSLGGGSSVTVYGVPTNLLQPGDLNQVVATAVNGAGTATQSTRSVYFFTRDITGNNVINLGPVANAATFTTLTPAGPYARIRAAGTWQTQYSASAGVTYVQGSKSWTVSASRGYVGAASATYELDIPDLAGLAGFNNAWGLTAGQSTQASLSLAGALGLILGNPVENSAFSAASITQTITP